MRFLSFLPMLLLLAGSLGAQNQCSIFDLTATVVTTDPSSCQYYVVLDFEHTGTTNQFTVKGNGVNYGTFPYDSVPVKLGPFTGDSIPSVKEFVVTDAVFQDCQDDVSVQIPACPSTAVCDIYDLEVLTATECNPGSLTYKLKLNFKVKNPGNDLFEVWAGNGTYLGFFPLSQLPLTIPVFPWSGDPTDQIKICINDNPDCCETLTFPAPDCNQTPCIVENLTVESGECTSDSTYKATIKFDLNNSSILDKFGVWANDEYLGIYDLDDLPLTIDNFPWSGDSTDEVRVCVLDIVLDPQNPQIICCKIAESRPPDCLLFPCGIKDFVLETDSCSTDSTFRVWVKFAVNDSSAVDSFRVWGNGHDLGLFSFDSLPLHIPDFPWNGSVFNFIEICTGNDSVCCEKFQFVAPDCLPFGPCEVTDLTVQTGKCSADSTYKVTLNFQATNPGDGTFLVWANGTLVDTFPLSAAPLTLDSFPWSGDSTDAVKICIGGQNDTLPCCYEVEYHVPNCLFADSCAISNVVVDPGDCNPGSQTYSLTLNFDVSHPGNDFFDLWTGNDVYLGNFPLSQLPIKIPAFPCTNNGVGVLKICINDNPDCCTTVEFQAPNCCIAGPCEISDLAVQTGDCSSDSTYEVWLNFDVENPLGDEFGVWANGEFLGNYSLDSLPLYFPEFPWDGGKKDLVKVCFITPNGAYGCCKTLEFEVPDCLPQPCEIYNLTVETGDCTSDSTYNAWINFQVDSPTGDTVGVWVNGEFVGVFAADLLPIHIEDILWDGGPNDFVKVCFVNANNPDSSATCCRTKEFEVPDCLDDDDDCEIFALTIETGDCTSDSTYQVTINFDVNDAPSDSFNLWTNGDFYGAFSLGSLPLQLDSFPWDGGVQDYLKVCLVGANGCCAIEAFSVPDCLDPGGPCDITDLTVEIGDCTSDSTYEVWVNFQVVNPLGNTFGLWANGEFYAEYSLDSLPIYIADFPYNGGPNDFVKVCFGNYDDPGCPVLCCATQEFAVPDCLPQPCEIYDLTVETGDCTSDSTYHATINFQVDNPPGNTFVLWINGELYDSYSLDSLPLNIDSFPWGGGPKDEIKVCFANAGAVGCCKSKAFEVPDCLDDDDNCEIEDLSVDTGDCTSDSTYQVWINFELDDSPSDSFTLWINGDVYGTFSLDSLPLNIANFPWGGGQKDVIKVCVSNTCCKTKEFEVPDCLEPGGPCHISDLTIETGDCTSDSTYTVTINFEVDNPPANEFVLWANDNILDTFSLDDLPLTIQDFPWDGGPVDHVKVCIFDNDAPPGQPFCCKLQPFQVPDCLNPGGDCEISNLTVETGDCTSDETYEVWINFDVDDPPGDEFGVWANGEYLGLFSLDSLPLYIADFPWDGGANDVVKVCFPSGGTITCCKTKEFEVPDCLNPDPCKIYDLQVLKTPCACDEFFAIVTFKWNNGGAEGFDIVGNGNNYGTFPYDTTQPIIIGPLLGDGTTNYEFVVKDHLNPDCADDFNLGTVKCMSAVANPGNAATLTLSPNPASNWLNVTAQLQSGALIGEANVEIYHADGRLVRSVTVANGSNFQLNVSDLPSGVYRLSLLAAAGRVEGTFVKQH